MEVPGVVRSVKAPDGGADMESTMRSLGDTVSKFGVCGGPGSLMGSKYVPKSRDPSKRPSLEPGAEVKLLLSLFKSNMLSDETSETARISSGSKLEDSSGEDIPSKLCERAMVGMFCC